MKIDRLLSIVVYLLNRDLVNAGKLAERFGVSIRTIQRDMETINLAGIPLISVQGPSGGYGIMENYKMDRRLVTLDDLFFIVTALRGIGDSLEDRRIDDTLEKMRGLVPTSVNRDYKDREEKLHIDFSMLGGGPDQRKTFKTVQAAVNSGRLLKMDYTNNRLERDSRIVEPMTIVFQWRAWYLYAYCHLREGYRLFRISRIRNPHILNEGFRRRSRGFEEFSRDNSQEKSENIIELTLKFSKTMSGLAEEFYNKENLERTEDGGFIAKTRMPEDGWMYGYILSYGAFVEVLEPPHVRDTIRSMAGQISRIYE
ncbi:MAG: YafY family protein [Spirochaetia bacterium]|nr:YafY family protein [Spirochaetia bacterium]